MINLRDLKGLLHYLNSLPSWGKFTATNPKIIGDNRKAKCNLVLKVFILMYWIVANPEFVYKYSEYFWNGTYEISLLDFIPNKNILYKWKIQWFDNMPS